MRSAFHPLLGRFRIGASRLRPLSPKLHTSDCSFACPGSSTWVDKVPSRDTPSLNLADHRKGVFPGNPQVARNRIEHRLFAYISQNWRGKPLVTHPAAAMKQLFRVRSLSERARAPASEERREWVARMTTDLPVEPTRELIRVGAGELVWLWGPPMEACG